MIEGTAASTYNPFPDQIGLEPHAPGYQGLLLYCQICNQFCTDNIVFTYLPKEAGPPNNPVNGKTAVIANTKCSLDGGATFSVILKDADEAEIIRAIIAVQKGEAIFSPSIAQNPESDCPGRN